MSSPTSREWLPGFLQSPAGSAAPSAPAKPTNAVVAGIEEFSRRLLEQGDEDPMARQVPGAMRSMFEALLPMVMRLMRQMDEHELARGLRHYATELAAIADREQVTEGNDAAAGIA